MMSHTHMHTGSHAITHTFILAENIIQMIVSTATVNKFVINDSLGGPCGLSSHPTGGECSSNHISEPPSIITTQLLPPTGGMWVWKPTATA